MGEDNHMISDVTDRLEQIRKRSESATVAPWVVDTKENMGENWCVGCVMNCGAAANDSGDYSNYIVTTDNVPGSQMNGADARDDADFIANARQDVPWLLDEIERLRAENGRLQKHPIFAHNSGFHADLSNRLIIDYSEDGAAVRHLMRYPTQEKPANDTTGKIAGMPIG